MPQKNTYHHGDLRTALLDAALTIIAETGPQALSIRETARRAGVSHAAPYRHFADKDELIVAVIERGFELMQATMDAAKANAGAEPLAQFAAAGGAYIDFALSQPAYYRLMYNGEMLLSAGQERLQHTSANTFKTLVEDVKTCQQLNILRQGDPAHMALALIATIHGLVTLLIDNRVDALVGPNYDISQLRDGVLGTIFAGIGALPD